MITVLNPIQTERYKSDGFLCQIPVLSAAEVASFRASLEELEALNGGMLKRLDNAHLFFRWAYRLATHDRVVDVVGSILGDDILIDGTLMLCKYPQDKSYVSWHQDSVYSDWHLSPTVSAWIALSPSTARSGCMRVIPGSQKRGLLAHAEITDRDNMLRRGERIGIKVDEDEAVDLELHPGELSLHHCNIIHGSKANLTDEKRVGFIVRYVTSRISPRDNSLVRVRGGSENSPIVLAGEPAELEPATAFAAWREFTRWRQAARAEVAG